MAKVIVEQEQITWKRKEEDETITIEAVITTNYKTGDKQIIKGLRKEMNLLLSRLTRDLANAKQRDKEKDEIRVSFEERPDNKGRILMVTFGEEVEGAPWTDVAKVKARNKDNADN